MFVHTFPAKVLNFPRKNMPLSECGPWLSQNCAHNSVYPRLHQQVLCLFVWNKRKKLTLRSLSVITPLQMDISETLNQNNICFEDPHALGFMEVTFVPLKWRLLTQFIWNRFGLYTLSYKQTRVTSMSKGLSKVRVPHFLKSILSTTVLRTRNLKNSTTVVVQWRVNWL
jgi:hypothetical protein